MDIHKERCKKLKEIRKKIADTIGVDLHQTECTYEGKCSGTCPKCQLEEQQLNRALLAKTALATSVVAMSVGLTGCSIGQELEGDVVMVEPACSTTEEYLEGETEVISEDPETDNSEDYSISDEIMTGEVLVTTESSTEMRVLEGDIAYPEDEVN